MTPTPPATRALRLTAAALACVGLPGAPAPAQSPTTPPPAAPTGPNGALLSITARDQPVGAFLRDLFSRVGRPIVVSPNLTGTVNGVFTGTLDKIYHDIARAFQLVTYDDGAALYVYATSELGVQTIQTSSANAQRVVRQVQRLTNARNSVRVAGDGSIVASGTPRFIEQVATIARGGPPEVAGAAPSPSAAGTAAPATPGVQPPRPLEFRVFYLRYAHASDTSVTAGGQELSVPGVATTLQNLVLDQRPGGSAATNAPQFGVRPIRQSQPRLKGYGLDAVAPGGTQTPLLGLPATSRYGDAGGGGTSEVLGAPTANASDLVAPLSQDVVRIEASPQLNAVIVRDVPERMAAYDSLIRALDVEPQVVEVDATIIDIDLNKARDLGINWRVGSGGFGALFGSGNADADGRLLPVPGSSLRDNTNAITPSGMGGVISAIIGNNRQFVGRLTALETKNVARVVARPQVLTLSNIEAVFDRTRTFYVRVAGRDEVDLFNVTAGTVMRVTPHVFRDHDQTRIRVQVAIEDGSIDASSVDGIPIVDKASVSNQTMVVDGQSLLLGGMTVDEDSDIEYKLPLLGDIPVLGNLFKVKSKSKGHIERLFLISPHVVGVGDQAATMQVPAKPVPPTQSVPLTPGTRAGVVQGPPPAPGFSPAATAPVKGGKP